MADLPEIDAVRLERDEWRERVLRAERERDKALKLLRYADEGLMAEYRLRMGRARVSDARIETDQSMKEPRNTLDGNQAIVQAEASRSMETKAEWRFAGRMSRNAHRWVRVEPDSKRWRSGCGLERAEWQLGAIHHQGEPMCAVCCKASSSVGKSNG